MYPKEELESRVRRLKRWMARREVDLCLFATGPNMLYLSGTMESELLAVPLDGEPYLIARYAFGDEIARERSPFHVEVYKPFFGLNKSEFEEPNPFKVLVERSGEIKRVAVDFMDKEEMKKMRKVFRRGKKSVAAVDAKQQLNRMRAVKSDYEVSLMRESASISIKALESIEISPKMSEREIANLLDFEMRKLGADGSSFPTIVASGMNSFNAHHLPTERRVSEGDILLIDFGARYKGYCIDITRTYFIGNPTDEFLERYQAVLNAQVKAIDHLKAGATFERPDIEARKVLKAAGLLEYYVHSLGHGVGIEIHEEIRLLVGRKGVMEEGMVVTDEPGVYLRGWGGVRIEDTVLVGRNKGISLTDKLPKDPDYLRR
ncbi:MAG: Xaa-Pro peptidase family protein [Candidatus Korarchaeum sp.]|nr:Xaa-Pro peptidase family protein [Candidatus Korarchaeum sp.]MDW8035591.1 Xaa-Pro peptidase family protein [Candidatus Korarchaeum sp.]